MAAAATIGNLIKYGLPLLDFATEIFDRVREWRAPKSGLTSSVNQKSDPRSFATLEQVADAVAAQAELSKQLAGQINGIGSVTSSLSEQIGQLEADQNAHVESVRNSKEQVQRVFSEMEGVSRQSRLAFQFAGLSLAFSCVLLIIVVLR